MTGQLFKQYFLTDGIRQTPEWRDAVSHAAVFTKQSVVERRVFRFRIVILKLVPETFPDNFLDDLLLACCQQYFIFPSNEK